MKCQIWNHKTPTGKHGGNSLTLVLVMIFWIWEQNHKQQEQKSVRGVITKENLSAQQKKQSKRKTERQSTEWEKIFVNLISFLLKNFFKHLFILERQSMNGRGAEREGDTESEVGSRPWAVSTEPDVGLKLKNNEIRPEPKLDA